MKDGIELTTEEREILRQKRRERRKKEQEKKKKEKENKKLHEMLKPQTTKLNIISGDLLEKVKKGNNVMPSNSSSVKKPSKEIKFKDEEYPDLGVKVKAKFVNDVISTEIVDSDGRIMHSDRESNSEWETEVRLTNYHFYVMYIQCGHSHFLPPLYDNIHSLCIL